MNLPMVEECRAGALRPMMSGDGLVVRVRPFNGRLRRAQADGIATLAAAHGNGLIDLSRQGDIQLRGVRENSHAALIEGLRAMSLVDADAETESRRSVLVTPFWQTGEETEGFAAELTGRLSAPDAPQIPDTFGFAVDTGRAPVLQGASSDIRLERDAGGGLILVADGFDKGRPVTSETAIAEGMALARWFMEVREGHTRMAAWLAAGGALPGGFFVPRQRQTYVPRPGYTPLGAMVGLAFGQLEVKTLASLAKQGGLRMTPWRMLLVESARKLPKVPGVITDPGDPALQVVACTGAPRCPNGLVKTRTLARKLAPHVPSGSLLHVSGCAMGCAHPGAAPLTVTAKKDGFDLIREGRASDDAAASAPTSDDIIKSI